MIIETNTFTGNTEQKKIHAKYYMRKCYISYIRWMILITQTFLNNFFLGTIKKDGVFELEKPNDF